MIPSVQPALRFPPVRQLTVEPVGRVTPESGTIDVWSCSLEGGADVLERCHGWLSEDERTRAARFVRPEDGSRFIFAHGGLRVVLGRYVEVDPAALEFYAGPTGKPALVDRGGRPLDLRFNLSHSHGRMLIAVAHGQEVGIDLEQIRDNLESMKLAERFYTRAECQLIESRIPSDRALQFYRLWVAKEAYLKAQGTGIPSLQQCEILASASSARADVQITPESALQRGWTIQWLKCGAGWEGAVSAYGSHWSVRVLDAVTL